MSNIIHVNFIPDEENLQPGERMWGPQLAGIVKKHEPEGLQEEE
jgi:hypothetical protein